ncbi:hypothetical protein BCV70DRAFT_213148 [Testicularia cyperi]|uniref:Crossover junction endonuclease MUS81 n=1 Tax=Testicularia cyperi TaxID=1882483 RepID=A0A317XIF8_9BASI|nr:hypothetical protein BCV70DRAFT_213148 [Testicularia cyperi]
MLVSGSYKSQNHAPASLRDRQFQRVSAKNTHYEYCSGRDDNELSTSNALWLSFIAAWRDEAQARGSKVARTYQKAHQSLQACPIPFQHPCQTTQLAGIGPTIAARLEEELERWCRDNDQMMPLRPTRRSAASADRGAGSRKRSRPEPSRRDFDGLQTAQDTAVASELNQLGGHGNGNADARDATAGATRPRKQAKKRTYIPQHRSGAYGLLIGLLQLTRAGTSARAGCVSKTELIHAARPHSDTEYEAASLSSRGSAAVPMSSQRASASGPASAARSFYSGWTSVKTLIAKGYVLQTGNPARYSLSEEGCRVAETLASDAGLEPIRRQRSPQSHDDDADSHESIDNEEDINDTDMTEFSHDGGVEGAEDANERDRAVRLARCSPTKMPAGSYTIHLIVDNRERHRFGRRQEREPIAALLRDKGVEVEVRALEVGDAIWMAKSTHPSGTEEDEVVLDYIVERKRLDDLTGSILDGRWRDQKFRLASSGLSQILYLIEDHDVENQMRKFGPQIQTALSSSQVVDGFFVERTSGLSASIEYLVTMDGLVRACYQERDLYVIPGSLISRSTFLQTRGELRRRRPDASLLTSFVSFQALNSKSGGLTLQEIFGKMLLCVRGMSAEKVREVVRAWSTPAELLEAYDGAATDEDRAAALLADAVDGVDQRKRIGPALSKKVAELFLEQHYRAG